MSAVLIHQGIMLLARERLGQIRDLLDAKIKSGLAVGALERQVHYLANLAYSVLSAAPQSQAVAPSRTFATALGRGVSTYAVMGTLGPWMASYAAPGMVGREWIGTTLRSAAPDPNRQKVHAKTTDFLIAFISRAQALIGAISDPQKKTATYAKFHAYVLGHVCRIAGDVVVNPILDDIESHYGTVSHPTRLSRAALEQVVDAVVAQQVFRKVGNNPTRRGDEWTRWWPATSDVPGELYDAYSDAFKSTYTAQDRPPGFSDWETANPNLAEMNSRFARSGYETFYMQLSQGYDWTWADWIGALAPAFVPAILAMPFIVLLPSGKYLFAGNRPEGSPPITLGPDDPPLTTPTQHYDEGKAWGEALAFPISAMSFVPLVYAIYVMGFTYLGTTTDSIVTMVFSIVLLILGIVNLSTSGVDMAGWVRGVFFFMVPALIDVIMAIVLLARNASEPYHKLLAIMFLSHLFLSFLTTLGYGMFRGWIGRGPGHGLFWVAILLWLLMIALPWLVILPAIFRNSGGNLAAELGGDEIIMRRHFARLYDDTALFNPTTVAAPTLADMFYPSSKRPLLKIWWTGTGIMHIRPRGNVIEFQAGALGANPVQRVLAPIAPMSLTELAAVMRRTITGTDAAVGLNVALVSTAAGDAYDLPASEMFADHGDLDAASITQAQKDAKTAEFHQLPSNTGGDPYILYHAPRTRLATRVGTNSVEVTDFRSGADTGVMTLTTSIAIGAGANDLQAAGPGGFMNYFRVGDTIECPVGTRSVVTAIIDDSHLTTQNPLGGLGAGTAAARRPQDRTIEVQGPGTVGVGAGLVAVVGDAATQFRGFFLQQSTTAPIQVGDLIRIVVPPAVPGGPPTPTDRTVVAVGTDAALTVDRPFSPTIAIPAGTSYSRMPSETRAGYQLVPSATVDLPGGDSAMEKAADLAALLCLGAVSRIQANVAGHDNPAPPAPVTEVAQIFRNWNLDSRRLNEWHMLVTGQATSEKRGDATAPDPILSPLPAGWTLRSTRGDKNADLLGWVPLLRKWLDVARRPGVSTIARTSLYAGDPTNLDLSRSIAYLLDIADPDPALP